MTEKEMIFGIRPTMEAINSGKEINKVLVQSGLKGELSKELVTLMREHNVTMQYVPLAKLNGVTRKNHQGVICYISPVHYYDIGDVIPQLYEDGKNPLILVLDGITDVRNFGAISRTAECLGVDTILIPRKGGALISADAIKTSVGALHKIPVCRSEDLMDDVRFLQNSGIKLVACTEKGTDSPSKVEMDTPTAIIMGSEEKGISDSFIKIADQLATIPMMGTISSLNVSVACGMLLYEANRQRSIK